MYPGILRQINNKYTKISRRLLIIILTILFIKKWALTSYLPKGNIEMNLSFKNENWGDLGDSHVILYLWYFVQSCV